MRRRLPRAFLLLSLLPAGLAASAEMADRRTDGWGDWAVWAGYAPLILSSSALLALAGMLLAWLLRNDRGAARLLGLAAVLAAAPSVALLLRGFAGGA